MSMLIQQCLQCEDSFEMATSTVIPLSVMPKVCPSCADKARSERKDKENESMAAKEKKERLNRFKMAQRNMPKKYKEAKLEDFREIMHNNRTVEDMGIKWIESDCWCVILSGDTGCGKTHFARACVREAFRQGYKSARFFFILDLIRKLQSDYSTNDFKALEELKNCELLVIDDMGAERLTDDSKQQIATIIHHREENERKTLITTNLTSEEIEANYTKRVASRLASGVPLRLVGKDRRKEF